ncbi:MAG: RHS repeat-associated core domain-containing protein [Chloroflexota bacterium]
MDGDLYYVLGDHLGSTSVVVDDSGSQVGHVLYDAYGAIVENTLPAGLTDRLYTGQVFDAATGLYYYNARYYDPYTGQFTQPDSLVADPLDPRAWNRFSYVYGDPVNYSDPSGHEPFLIGLGLFALAVGGTFAGAAYLDSQGYPQASNFLGLPQMRNTWELCSHKPVLAVEHGLEQTCCGISVMMYFWLLVLGKRLLLLVLLAN